MMSLIVQKYGGSSLSSTEKIIKVAEQIFVKKKEGADLVVVVSAMGNTTDELEALALEITSDPSRREMDMLLSAGERISMALLAMALHEKGVESISFTGSQTGIVTDTKHTNAQILEIKADRLQQELKLGKVVIVAGFQGVSVEKEITTLGRGGSDVTAVALAVRLGATRCEFYKNVDGVYTKDPHKFKDAKKLEACGYQDVLKLVQAGAVVFHPRAIEIAEKHSLPIHITSTFTPGQGTLIHATHV